MNDDETITEARAAGRYYDVVGGGVGGAYAAWRAKTGEKDPASSSPLPVDPAYRRVVLLEAGDRVGGRLESMVAPGTNGLMAEFGGMGFTEHDTIFTALVDRVLDLDPVPFDMPNAHDLVYVRGVHLTHARGGGTRRRSRIASPRPNSR